MHEMCLFLTTKPSQFVNQKLIIRGPKFHDHDCYFSALLHEHLLEEGKEELWEVAWRNEQNCPDFNVSYSKVQGIQPKQPQASKVAQKASAG